MSAKIVIGPMIRALLDENSMTMKALGLKLGKSESTVSKWISGTSTPLAKDLSKITNIFNVDIHTLMYGGQKDVSDILPIYSKLHPERQQIVYNTASAQLKEQQSADNVVSLDDAREERQPAEPAVPIDVDGIVAAGYGAFNDNRSEPMETVTLPDSVIPTHYDFCFKVGGDSMSPYYEDGELVFVQKAEDPTNGMIAVVDVDDMTFIKKLIFEQDRLCLRSLNDDVDEETGKRIYPDFYADETDNIDIIGRVVGSYAFK